MKRGPIFAVGALLLTISACNRRADVAAAPASATAAPQQAELERCRNRGVQVYDDRACMDAWKKRTNAFYGKSGEDRQ